MVQLLLINIFPKIQNDLIGQEVSPTTSDTVLIEKECLVKIGNQAARPTYTTTMPAIHV